MGNLKETYVNLKTLPLDKRSCGNCKFRTGFNPVCKSCMGNKQKILELEHKDFNVISKYNLSSRMPGSKWEWDGQY